MKSLLQCLRVGETPSPGPPSGGASSSRSLWKGCALEGKTVVGPSFLVSEKQPSSLPEEREELRPSDSTKEREELRLFQELYLSHTHTGYAGKSGSKEELEEIDNLIVRMSYII